MLGITNVSNAPSIVLKDTVVSTWTSGSYNGYSYRGTIPITGVTADTIAEVTFSQAQAESGNYSSVCTTYDGGLYVYSKVNTQITIPSIIIHSIVETYYELDNSPVSGSTKAVTSGGVYTELTKCLTSETIDLSSYSAGNNIDITGIGTKLTNCKYAILYWHDSRQTSYHMSDIFPGQTGGYGVALNVATYEYVINTNVYIIGTNIQNVSANRIIIKSKFGNIGSNSWGDYNSYLILEKIVFVY